MEEGPGYPILVDAYTCTVKVMHDFIDTNLSCVLAVTARQYGERDMLR